MKFQRIYSVFSSSTSCPPTQNTENQTINKLTNHLGIAKLITDEGIYSVFTRKSNNKQNKTLEYLSSDLKIKTVFGFEAFSFDFGILDLKNQAF